MYSHYGDCSCKEEQIKLQECEAKLSHLQDVSENNVQSKVAMTNLGLLNISVKENSNSSAICDCSTGLFGILEILIILALVIFLLGLIYSLARSIWIKRRMKNLTREDTRLPFPLKELLKLRQN